MHFTKHFWSDISMFKISLLTMVMPMLSASGRQDCSAKHDREIKGRKTRAENTKINSFRGIRCHKQQAWSNLIHRCLCCSSTATLAGKIYGNSAPMCTRWGYLSVYWDTGVYITSDSLFGFLYLSAAYTLHNSRLARGNNTVCMCLCVYGVWPSLPSA